MNIYSIDVQVCATAYIRANNEKEARKVAEGLQDSSPDILDAGGDVEVSGLAFDNPDLPDVSLSPAMTIHGVWPGAEVERADD